MSQIVESDLRNLSGTSLQRTGAVYGPGIYCTPHFSSASSYSAPGKRGYRVVLLCEIADPRVIAKPDDHHWGCAR